MRNRWRWIACETFAHHQRQHVGKRCLNLFLDIAKSQSLAPHGQDRSEILPHARHRHGADRLNPGLFRGLKDGACIAAARP